MTQDELTSLKEQVLALPREQKEALLAALQANLAPIPDWHRRVIDDRIAAADADPDSFTPAPEVVERVRANLRRD